LSTLADLARELERVQPAKEFIMYKSNMYYRNVKKSIDFNLGMLTQGARKGLLELIILYCSELLKAEGHLPPKKERKTRHG